MEEILRTGQCRGTQGILWDSPTDHIHGTVGWGRHLGLASVGGFQGIVPVTYSPWSCIYIAFNPTALCGHYWDTMGNPK